MNKKVSSLSLRLILALSLLIPSIMPLAGCDYARNQLRHDREGDMEFQGYRDAMAPRLPDPEDEFAKDKVGSVPELQPYVATETANMKSMPLVSISVNQSVALRDVLFELARQADYDVELDPNITGAIIFSAKNRPFDQVVERICDISGLRYKFENDVLRVEVDRPYNKTYKIDYLSYVRNSKSSINTNISVVSGDGADTGSDFSASGSSEANFWGELETNLTQLLGGKVSGALKTKKTPKVTSVETNVVETNQAGQSNQNSPSPDAAAAAAAQNPAAGEEGLAQNAAAITSQANAPLPQDQNAAGVQNAAATAPAAPKGPPEATLRIESLPDEEDTSDAADAEFTPTFTINKQAGLISVYATDKAQKEVETYLQVLKRAVTSQVLIEAKILEVSLSDEYAAGIDWNSIGPIFNDRLNLALTGTDMPAFTEPVSGNFTAGIVTDDLNAAIEAVSRFGTVRSLSNPRLTVLNNQPAALTVATNHVYFELDITRTEATDTTAATTDIESEAKSVPVGVIINVQPSINLETGAIALALRPTVTKIDEEIEDPAIAFLDTDVTAVVPQLDVQEIDSVIQVHSGQAIVMGGLLQDENRSNETGVPGLSEAPMIGSLFKRHDDTINKSELVIFLKATILDNPADSVAAADKDLYRQFSGDRRPMKFTR